MTKAAELISNGDWQKVNGWVTPEVMHYLDAWVASYANALCNAEDFGSMLEIGVHHGKMFLGMERIMPSSCTCYAVDVFEDQQKNIDQSGKGDLAKFIENVERLSTSSKRVVPVKTDSFSLSVSKVVSHRYALISIDGGHTREHAAFDLNYADETIMPGGLIVLDDFPNTEWLGVVEGTLDFLNKPNRRIIPFMVGFNKLLFTTFSESEVVRESMQDYLADNCPNLELRRMTNLRGYLVRPVRRR